MSPNINTSSITKPICNIDAEKSVLGAMMLSKLACSTAIQMLKVDDIWLDKHKVIFNRCVELAKENINIDIITLAEALSNKKELASAGGTVYLMELSNFVPSAQTIVKYCLIVKEKSILRQTKYLLEKSLNDIHYSTQDVGGRYDYKDPHEILNDVEAEISFIHNDLRSMNKTVRDISEISKEMFLNIEKAIIHKNSLIGIPSGFTKLDEIMGGFQKTNLYVIAARPSMGKTAFLLSLVRNIGLANAGNVAVFSLEMSSIQLGMRLLSAETGISQMDLARGKIKQTTYENQLNTVTMSLDKISKWKLIIDDAAGLKINDFKLRCRDYKKEFNIDIILCDYMQLFRADKAETREREISIISQTMKIVAKELDIPIVALAQLNRATESNSNKVPELRNIRESGSIEQDADFITFIHRPEYYGINQDEFGNSNIGKAELIIAKHRNGPIGMVEVGFDKSTSNFYNIVENYSAYKNEDKPIQESAGF